MPRRLTETAATQRRRYFAIFRRPEAWLFKGPPTTTLSASTSTDCGYVTFYGDSPKSKKGTA